jgi:hypothetical protein
MPGDILLDGLRELLEGSTILTEPADQAQFLSDWHGRNHGAARCVVLPRTTADVAAVVALCARLGVPVFPQGGNTSVNIGSIPSTDGRGIVLSLNRMNRVLSVERSANAMIVEAGCVLASVHEAAASVDRKTLAVTPIIARSKTPQIHAGVVDELIDPVKFPNAYRTGASNRQWENAASGYVIDVLKQQQIAVIGDSSGYGTSTVQDSSADIAKRGAKVAYSSLVELTTPDLTAELIRARNAGSEAILAWSTSAGLLARLLNARGDLAWNVPVAGHPALGSGEVQHLLSKPEYWGKVYQVGFRTCCFGPDDKLPAPQAAFVANLAGKVELKDTTLWWVAWG